MPPPRPEPPSVRYIAYVIWGATLGGALIMAVVAAVLGPDMRSNFWEPYPKALAISAALTNMVLLPGSRLIIRALKPETPTLQKNLAALVVSEVGAIFAAIAWLLTGSSHAVAGLIMGLSGIAVAFPNDSRWRALGGTVAADVPGGDGGGRSDR